MILHISCQPSFRYLERDYWRVLQGRKRPQANIGPTALHRLSTVAAGSENRGSVKKNSSVYKGL